MNDCVIAQIVLQLAQSRDASEVSSLANHTVFDKVRPVAAVSGYVTARNGPVKDWRFIRVFVVIPRETGH